MFKQIHPQPARGKLVESMWEDPAYVAEIKYDGFRLVGQMDDHVHFTTRRVSVKTNELQIRTEQVPHLSACAVSGEIASRLMRRHAPPKSLRGTVLDGEIIPDPATIHRMLKTGGGISKAVGSIMNSLPDEAIRKQIDRGWLQWIVFDCLYWKGEDVRHLPLEERRRYARCAVETWGNKHVSLAAQTGADKRGFYNAVIKDGGEGVILKRLDHRYGDEKGWVKVKKEVTADVVIIGFKPAKATSKKVDGKVSATKYAGKVGSVEIGQYVTRANCVSVGFARGFSDRLMDEFTRCPKKYLGKVITIEANDREPTGKFRHPRVCHPDDPFRTDKAPTACIFDLNEK